MTQAETIRHHIVEHHIAPAQRQGHPTVTVTAGEIHKELGLRNRVPSVCQVMESRLLEREGGVKVSSKQGPPSGRGTTLSITYAVKATAPEPEPKRVWSEKGLLAFYALRGAGKDLWKEFGGGEGWLKKERANFYSGEKKKKFG